MRASRVAVWGIMNSWGALDDSSGRVYLAVEEALLDSVFAAGAALVALVLAMTKDDVCREVRLMMFKE